MNKKKKEAACYGLVGILAVILASLPHADGFSVKRKVGIFIYNVFTYALASFWFQRCIETYEESEEEQ